MEGMGTCILRCVKMIQMIKDKPELAGEHIDEKILTPVSNVLLSCELSRLCDNMDKLINLGERLLTRLENKRFFQSDEGGGI